MMFFHKKGWRNPALLLQNIIFNTEMFFRRREES